MDWTTLIPLALVGYDKIKERRSEEERAAAEAAAIPAPLVFPDQQVAAFTRPVGPHRAFDKDVGPSILGHLSFRSLAPFPDPSLAQHGRAWLVVPFSPGLPTAPEIIGQAFADPSVVVLGSHSLFLIPGGSPAPMVILVGPPAARILALSAAPDRVGGVFAILERPEAPAVEAAPTLAPEEAPAPPAVAVPFPPMPVTLENPTDAERVVHGPVVLGKIETVRRAVPRTAPNGAKNKNGAEPSDPEVLVPTVEE